MITDIFDNGKRVEKYLAFVTLDVKTAVEGNDTNRFFLAGLGHDRIVTHRTARSKFPSFKSTSYHQSP